MLLSHCDTLYSAGLHRRMTLDSESLPLLDTVARTT